jgi:hypothetical protein
MHVEVEDNQTRTKQFFMAGNGGLHRTYSDAKARSRGPRRTQGVFAAIRDKFIIRNGSIAKFSPLQIHLSYCLALYTVV